MPGLCGYVALVSYQNNRQACVFVQSLQYGHDLFAGPAVEVPCRLVGEQDSRLLDQRSGDAYSLLLAAGELGGLVVGAVSESDAVEGLQSAPFAVGAVSVHQRKLDVGARRQPGEEVVGLEDKADLPSPYLGESVVRHAAYVLTVQHVATARRDVEAANDVHEGGLS